MDEQDVDRIDPEPLEAILERAHHAVVAVVEHGLEFEAAEPLVMNRAGTKRPAKNAADLGRHHIIRSRPSKERAPKSVLGKAAAIPRRGVEIAHASRPGAGDQGGGFAIVDALEELAERRGAEAQFGDVDLRAPQLPCLEGRGRRAHSSGSVPKRSG